MARPAQYADVNGLSGPLNQLVHTLVAPSGRDMMTIDPRALNALTAFALFTDEDISRLDAIAKHQDMDEKIWSPDDGQSLEMDPDAGLHVPTKFLYWYGRVFVEMIKIWNDSYVIQQL